MDGFIKRSWKVLFNYIISLALFCIFSYFFLTFTGDNFNTYLPYYCFVTFLAAYYLIYSDMKKAAVIERKPQSEAKPYALKGFVYGLAAFLPIAFIEAVSTILVFNDKLADHAKHIAINILMGPLYFMIRIFNESPLGYVLATLIIPLTAMLGYLAGYYGVDVFKHTGKSKTGQPEKSFKKSPWNPTLKNPGKGGKKKPAAVSAWSGQDKGK